MKPMKSENSTDAGFTANIYSKETRCNLISFPRFLLNCMVPTFLEVNNNFVAIGNNINYHDGHDSTIYIPYKVACSLDSEISEDDTYIEHMHVLGFPLTLTDACAYNKDLKYIKYDDYKLAESYEKGENQFTKCKNGLIIIPKKLNNIMSNIRYIGYFKYEDVGIIYPTYKYDIRISTTDDNTLYIPPDLAEFLEISNHEGQLLCFGTIKGEGNMNTIEEKNITKNVSEIHFQLPATINKSIGEKPEVVLSIPFQYILTIKPLFCSIVDSLKEEVEQSMIKQITFDTIASGFAVISNGYIDKIELKREYFENLIYRTLSKPTTASNEIHFTLNRYDNYDQHIKIDPDESDTHYGNLFDFLVYHIDKWIKDNSIKATIKSGDIDLIVDKLQICNTLPALLEIYGMDNTMSDKISSNLQLMGVEIFQTGGENKNE